MGAWRPLCGGAHAGGDAGWSRECARERAPAWSRRDPRHGGVVRRASPLLAPLVPGLPQQHATLVARVARLRAFRRRHLHRALRLLAVDRTRAIPWQLRSVREFARRRAWRILPPYWAALAFSLAVAWWIVAQPGTDEPTGKSVAVYGFLVQDLFGSPSPNGAFWSIAIEAQLYLLFPLLLMVRRRWGAAVMLASITAIVVMTAALSPHESHVDKLMRLTASVCRVVHGRHRRRGDPRAHQIGYVGFPGIGWR